MELKYVEVEFRTDTVVLLIVPCGIEILLENPILDAVTLLIVPCGIEMKYLPSTPFE